MNKLFTKKYLLSAIAALFFTGLAVFAYLLSTDDYTDARFRTMQDDISSTEKVDLTGLRELQASGGPVIHFPTLKKQLTHIHKPIIVVDGMGEQHGYINKVSTSFLGYHRRHLQLRYLVRRLLLTGSTLKLWDKMTPESEIAKKYGFEYKNINIDSRLITPVEYVDAFVDFFDHPPESAWFHFHCRHGKGRTSMSLVMYDIMKNAPTVSLTDIVRRHHLLGSVDLFDTTVWKKGTYPSQTLVRRKKFIEDFYTFISQRKAGGFQRWSEWYTQHNNDTVSKRTP